MSARIKRIVAWWFVLQIVLPFTAPLQTVDVHDLFGQRTHHRSQGSPESTTTPTLSESIAAVQIATTIQTAAPVRAHEPSFALALSARRPIAIDYTLSSSPQVQQSVLRL